MNTILVSLLALLAPPVAPVDALTTLAPVAKICVEADQRPMMGDPHGPPVVCMKDGDTDFPLKHGSCGTNCTTHVPADDADDADGAADPKVPMRIDFFCPGGAEVRAVSYQLDGQKRVVLRSGSAANTLSSERDIPFSKAKVAAACKQALGGTWLKDGKHSNPRERIATTLEKTIELRGGCEGEDKLRRSRFRIRLAVTCVDEDF